LGGSGDWEIPCTIEGRKTTPRFNAPIRELRSEEFQVISYFNSTTQQNNKPLFAYNKLVLAYNKLVLAYNKLVLAYNKLLSAYNKLLSAYNKLL